MTSCPSPEQFENLLAGRLNDLEEEVLNGHVCGCSDCRRVLEAMTAPSLFPYPNEQRLKNEHGLADEEGFRSFLATFLKSNHFPDEVREDNPVPLPEAGAMAPRFRPSPKRKPPPTVPGYEIIDELGRGGLGVVYRAVHQNLKRRVALKIIRAGAEATVADLTRFRREAETLAQVQHPNIVQIHEIGDSASQPFFCMELVEGGNLEQWAKGKPQPPRVAAQLVETLARAMHAVHQQGIVHRDLKPSNILLALHAPGCARRDSSGSSWVPGKRAANATPTRSLRPVSPSREEQAETAPSGSRTPRNQAASGLNVSSGSLNQELSLAEALELQATPKISDFGLAKFLDQDSKLTQSRDFLGTPSYMSPEQAKGGSQLVGPASDVYALGAVLYELLTGRPPFAAATPLDTLFQVLREEPVPPCRLQSKVPPDLETICLKCLAKLPGQRYASAEALADDLGRFGEGRPIVARPVGTMGRGWRWCRRNPALAMLLGALVVVLLAGIGGVVSQLWRADAEWQRAEAKADVAEQAQREASKNLEQAEANLYFSQIAQARLEWRLNNVAGADLLLDQCQPRRRGWEWHYLKSLNHSDLVTLDISAWPLVFGVAISPDGRWMVLAGGNPFPAPPQQEPSAIRIFDTTTFQEVRSLNGHRASVWSVAFSADGQRLISGDGAGVVKVWEAATGKEIVSFQAHSGPIRSVDFSPDGRRLASATSVQPGRVWDSATGQQLFSLPATWPVKFSPDGKLLVSGGGDIGFWDAKTGKELRRLGDRAHSLAFSPDGKLLVGAATSAKIWDVATGRLVTTLSGYFGDILGVAFSPDGRLVATAGADSSVRLWEARSGVEDMTLRGHLGRVACVCFDATGQRLISGGQQPAEVKVWDLTQPPEYRPLVRSSNFQWRDFEALGFAADGQQVALLRTGGHLQKYDSRTGGLLWDDLLDFPNSWFVPANLGVFSADGRLLAGVSSDPHQFKVWDAASGQELRTLRGHTQRISHLAFSGDGRRLVSAALPWKQAGQTRREVTVWDSTTGQALAALQPHLAPVKWVHGLAALNRNGAILAYDDYQVGETRSNEPRLEAKVKVRELDGQRELASLPCESERLTSLTFSQDGQLLAAADQNGKVFVWNATTWRPLYVQPLRGLSYQLAFSPDNQRLAGVNREQVLIWDVVSGRQILILHGAPPRNSDGGFNPKIAWSPDGGRLAATNWNHTYSVWDMADTQTPAGKQALRRAAADRAFAWHLRVALDSLLSNEEFAVRFHLKWLRGVEPPNPALHLMRGSLLGQSGQWDQAAVDYDRAFRTRPPADPESWLQYAVLRAWAGDLDGYRRLCQQMLERYGHQDKVEVIEPLAIAFVGIPHALADARPLVPLAEKLVAAHPKEGWPRLVLGMAQYRTGHPEAALRPIREGMDIEPAWPQMPLNWLALVLVHQTLGQPREARQWLDKTERWFADTTRNLSEDAARVTPKDWNWWDWLGFHLLRREAEALLGKVLTKDPSEKP